MTAALIVGLSGLHLRAEEAEFLRQAQPAGIILFGRNCQTPGQVLQLTEAAAQARGGALLVGIDQEGGRVQRLRPPCWRALPPAGRYLARTGGNVVAACALARQVAQLTAFELRAVGITMNCAPVLDLRFPGAHEVIGDRAFSSDVDEVAELGRAVGEGLMAGGVVPVVKHIPGHGRALVDSHHALPLVEEGRDLLEATDFEPFRRLADMPAAMTAHVLYAAVDDRFPASISRKVTDEIIRGSIGFGGLLMSDDLSMQALDGTIRDRAEAVIRAGSDVALHCNGQLSEMWAAREGVAELEGEAGLRFSRCLEITGEIQHFDLQLADASLQRLLQV